MIGRFYCNRCSTAGLLGARFILTTLHFVPKGLEGGRILNGINPRTEVVININCPAFAISISIKIAQIIVLERVNNWLKGALAGRPNCILPYSRPVRF